MGYNYDFNLGKSDKNKLLLNHDPFKKGVDFEGIGFYLIGKNDEIIEVEDLIDIGDVGIAYATVYHGVAPVNTNKKPDWDDVDDGRWFLSMYSNETDIYKKRHTSSGGKIKSINIDTVKSFLSAFALEKFVADIIFPYLVKVVFELSLSCSISTT